MFFIVALFAVPNNAEKIPFLIIPPIMFVFGVFLFKFLVFDLVDEVYDEGDSLRIINSRIRVDVKLKDIENLNYQPNNPPKITLSLRYETELGDELSFSPPRTNKLFGFGKNKIALELIDRIDEARKKDNKISTLNQLSASLQDDKSL